MVRFMATGEHYLVELCYSKWLGCWVIDRMITDSAGDQTWKTYQLGSVLNLTTIQLYNHEVAIAKSFGSW